MTALLLLLLSAPAAPLHEQAFRLERPAEAVAVIGASCERCDWAVRGREAAVLALSLDGAHSQHLVLARGTRAEYRVLLGAAAAKASTASRSRSTRTGPRAGRGRCGSRA